MTPEPEGNVASGSTTGARSPADLSKRLATALEGDARFSSAQAHGKPSLCPDSAGETVLDVWSVESGKDPLTGRPGFKVNCFSLSHPVFTSFASMRDAQDAGVLRDVTQEWFAPEEGATIAFQYADKTFWALEVGKTVKLLRLPVEANPATSAGRGSGNPFANRRAISFDELTADAGSARSINPDADRSAFIAAVEKALSAHNKREEASDDAELAAVRLPRREKTSRALVRAGHKWLVRNAHDTGIDPKWIKSVYISDHDWSIDHDRNIPALIKGKVISATVTFKKDNGKCYFMSFELERDYAGGGRYNSQVYGNGFQSGYTQIRCSEI